MHLANKTSYASSNLFGSTRRTESNVSMQLRQDMLDMFVTVVTVNITVVIAVKIFSVFVNVMMITKFLVSMSDGCPHLSSNHTMLIVKHN